MSKRCFSWNRLDGSIDLWAARSREEAASNLSRGTDRGTRCPDHLGLHPYYIPAQ